MWCAKFCTGMLLCKWYFWVSTCCKHFTMCILFCFSTRFSDISPNVANVMQFAHVSFMPMQIFCNDRVLNIELMLHKTIHCAGVSCKAHQDVTNTEQILWSPEILTPSDHNIVRWFVQRFGFSPSIQHKEPFSPFTRMAFAQKAAYT